MKKLIKFLFLFVLFVSLQSCSKENQQTGNNTSSDGKTETGNNTENKGSSGNSSGDLENLASNGFEITYQISGMMEGTSTTTVKNKRFKSAMKYGMAGQNIDIKSYSDGDWIYTIMDMGVMKKNTKMKISEDMKSKDPTNIDYGTLKEQLAKYKKVGTETIIGKECDIYEMSPGATMSVYNNMIPLKIKSEGMTLEATSLNLDANISESDLDPPGGITYEEVKLGGY
ncbi:MAG TPA: hypothetical protein PLG90_04455 [Ignavibacteria bacterium]|nr:hypothetical protein [Ignavibacteria bacterium]